MRRYLTILLSCVVWAAASGLAFAGERVMLPYACSFENGRLVLRPSPMRSYAVLGERIEEPMTDCSMARADECRVRTVHQFSIACNGLRVPWMRAVAAIRSNTGLRSWIENGRLKIVFPSRNGVRSACLDDITGGRGAQQASSGCLPWRRADAASAMTLKPGFAPVDEIGARLVYAAAEGDTETGSIGTSDPAAASDARILIGATAAEASDAPMNMGWVTVIDTRGVSERASAASFSFMPRWSLTWALMGLLSISSAFFAWRAGYGNAVVEFYRNRRADLHRSGLRRGWDELAAHLSRAGRSHAGRSDASRSDASRSGAGRSKAGGSNAGKGPEAPGSMGENLDNAATFVSAVLADAQERVGRLGIGPLRGVLEQELHVISQRLNYTCVAAVDGREPPARAAGIFRTLVREVERLRRIAESAETDGGGLARDGAALPRSRSEAFAVLGVNPDVSESIAKKLVDALRMSWHPDLSKDEADRLLREDRIKQINVAWELINGKRNAA